MIYINKKMITHAIVFFITLIFFGCNVNETSVIDDSQTIISDWQSNAQFSKDGEKIVFEGLYNNIYAIHFIDKGGNYLGKILETKDKYISSPTWGNNNLLAVSIEGNLFTIKNNGDSIKQVTFSGEDFSCSFSNDGKYIAYTKSVCDPDCGIALFDLNNNSSKVIGKYGGYASWNINSSKVYYYHPVYNKRRDSNISDYKGFVFSRIDIETLKEDSLFYISDSNLWLEDCTISPDEKEILFAASEGNPPQVYIWKITIENQILEKITVGNHPSFSPDGSRIVYTNTDKSEGGLWIMNHEGSNRQRLTKLNR
jgi:Tol biopolymer transport system component